MATFQPAQWAVTILVERDPSLSKVYQLSPNTTLAELMKIWCDEFGLFESWTFLSDDGKTTFDDDSMTLDAIEESRPNTKIVILRAELSTKLESKPVNEVFVCKRNRCHSMGVSPQESLHKVMRRTARRPTTLEHNGVPLHLWETLERAGIKDKAVFHKPCSPVTAKLSTGDSKTIHLPSGSLVLHLMDRLRLYETEDFSLMHEGRLLSPQETATGLKHVVEVKREEFVVDIDGQCVRWLSRCEPIPFPEFISNLSMRGRLDKQNLQAMTFCCVGCRRHICQSKTHLQQLPINCCKEKSLTLIADSKTITDARSIAHATKYIEKLCERLFDHKAVDLKTKGARDKCRKMKEEISEERLDYNAIIQCSERFRREIQALVDKIKTFENTMDAMKNTNKRLDDENNALQEKSNRMTEEKKKLENENNKLKEENKKHMDEREKMQDQNNDLADENDKLKVEHAALTDDNRRLQEENRTLNDEIVLLDEENNKLNDENNKLRDNNVKLKEQNGKVKDQNKEMMNECDKLKKQIIDRREVVEAGAPQQPLPKTPKDKATVKLAVVFDPSVFAVSQPSGVAKLGYHSCIKVEISTLQPGWQEFKAVKNALLPFFSIGWVFSDDILDILQLRGDVAGQEVTEMTSLNTDEFETELERKTFCSIKGQLSSWEHAGKPRRKNRCCAANKVLICGGGRRTVLQISHL